MVKKIALDEESFEAIDGLTTTISSLNDAVLALISGAGALRAVRAEENAAPAPMAQPQRITYRDTVKASLVAKINGYVSGSIPMTTADAVADDVIETILAALGHNAVAARQVLDRRA